MLLREDLALFLENFRIDRDAVEFHLGQHIDERCFDFITQFGQGRKFLELGFHQVGQSQRYVGVLGRVTRNPVQRDLGHADLLLTAANQVGDGDGLKTQQRRSQRIHVVGIAARIHERGRDHAVQLDAAAA